MQVWSLRKRREEVGEDFYMRFVYWCLSLTNHMYFLGPDYHQIIRKSHFSVTNQQSGMSTMISCPLSGHFPTFQAHPTSTFLALPNQLFSICSVSEDNQSLLPVTRSASAGTIHSVSTLQSVYWFSRVQDYTRLTMPDLPPNIQNYEHWNDQI